MYGVFIHICEYNVHRYKYTCFNIFSGNSCDVVCMLTGDTLRKPGLNEELESVLMEITTVLISNSEKRIFKGIQS